MTDSDNVTSCNGEWFQAGDNSDYFACFQDSKGSPISQDLNMTCVGAIVSFS